MWKRISERLFSTIDYTQPEYRKLETDQAGHVESLLSRSYGSTSPEIDSFLFQPFDEPEEGEDVEEDEKSLVTSHEEAGHGTDHPTNSLTATFINLMKTSIGTGILAIPDAVKNAGLVVGGFGILFLGLLSAYCCHQLLHAYRCVAKGKAMSYSQVTHAVFYKAGGRYRKVAKFFKHLINAFLIITQIGLCCIFLLFIARMMKEIFDQARPTQILDIRVYQVIVMSLLIPYCFVKTLKVLSYFALFANFAQLVSLIIVLQYVVRNLQPIEHVNSLPPEIAKLPLFFGTTMFAFEMIAFILPMENRMTDRQAFHGWNGLFSLTISVVVCLYVFVGFYGYLAFGDEAKMILSNMPKSDGLFIFAKVLYSVAIFLTYNLQLYVIVAICFPWLKKHFSHPWFDAYGEYCFRTILVIISFGLSAGVPCLELLYSFFGAIGAGSLASVFPPLLELISCNHPGTKLGTFTKVKSSILLAIGFTGCTCGAVVALIEIIRAVVSEGCPI